MRALLLKAFLFLLWLCFLFPQVVQAEDYLSLHKFSQTVYWCSPEGGENCENTSGLCPYIFNAPPDQIYRCWKRLLGFKNINNPWDPQIFCHYEAPSSQECLEDRDEWGLVQEICYLEEQNCRATAQIPSAFKIFLPPGTESLTITMHFWRDALAGVAIRYMAPPEAYVSLPNNFEAIPWEPQGEVISEEKFWEEELYFRNVAGTLTFSVEFSHPLSEPEAGWLYFRLLPQFEQTVHAFKAFTRVNLFDYTFWYSLMKDCEEPHSTLYCWDIVGDPVREASVPPLSVKPKIGLRCFSLFDRPAVMLSVEDCGSYCTRPVRVLIGAVDPSFEHFYSCVYNNGSFQWKEGKHFIDLPTGIPKVSNLDLAPKNINYSVVKGWYVGVAVDLNGDGEISLPVGELSEEWITTVTCP